MKWIMLLPPILVLAARLGVALGWLPPLRPGAVAELGIVLLLGMSVAAFVVLPGREGTETEGDRKR